MRIFQRLLLVGLGTALALLTTEGMLWAMGYRPAYYYPRFLFAEDAELGYRLRPGFTGQQTLGEFNVALTINESGLRGPQAVASSGETYRILGLGDSFTFGTGVVQEQTYLAQLSQRFQENGYHVDVVNAGVPGYGTRQELTFLKREGARYQPDLVLIGFLAFNDPYDNVMPNPIVKDGFLLNAISETAPVIPLRYRIKSFLRTTSVTYSMVTNRLKESPTFRPLLVRMGLGDEAFPVEIQFYLRQPPPGVEETWRATFALFDELQRTTAQMDSQLLVVLIPSRAQVYRERWRRVAARYHLDETTADPLLPTEKAAQYFEKRNIAYVDLLPRFRELAESGAHLYFDLDGHWSPEGHRAASECIVETLRSRVRHFR